MLDWVLYYRTGIARVLAVILASATAFYIGRTLWRCTLLGMGQCTRCFI